MAQCAHLSNFSAAARCEVVALADVRENTARQVAIRYGIPSVYNDIEGMLANEDLDAIVAILPFQTHGQILPQILRYGKPVLIEKPLAISPAVAHCITQEATANRTWIMVGYHKRSDPATQYTIDTIREWSAHQEFGHMRYLRLTMPMGDWRAEGMHGLIDAGDLQPAFASDPFPLEIDTQDHDKYRQFLNFYSHQINLIRYLLGEDYELCFADSSGITLHARSLSGIPVVLEMTPYNTWSDWQESVLVCFDNAFIHLKLPPPLAVNRAGSVEIMQDRGRGKEALTRSPHLPPFHAMRRQVENFLAAVEGQAPPISPAEDAVKDLDTAVEYMGLMHNPVRY